MKNIKFIKQTAKDYDMEYYEVELIWDQTQVNNETGKNFYPELENFIKQRRIQT